MRLEELRGTRTTDNVDLVGNANRIVTRELSNPSFATNLINRCFDYTIWRPKYYVCTDPFVLDNYREDVEDCIKSCEIAFLPHDALQYTGGSIVRIIVRGEDTGDLPITEGIYGHGTTLFIALQIAEYIGYEQVTFRNCDLYFGNSLHFYHDDPMNRLSPEELSRRRLRSIQAHFWMIVYADKHKMRVRYM